MSRTILTAKTQRGMNLYQAAQEGDVEAVRQLLEDTNTDVNEVVDYLDQDSTALFAAAQGGYQDVVELLLAHGADVNVGESPLVAAVGAGHLQVVQQLLNAGADAKASFGFGRTPLHVAADCGHTQVAAALLQAGADVQAVTQHKNTALLLAAAQGGAAWGMISCWSASDPDRTEGGKSLVQVLLDAGAAVHAADSDNMTALHHAAACGEAAVIQALLAAGADPAATDNRGRTALHHAAVHGVADAVRPLLAAAATDAAALLAARDDRGATALNLAVERGHAAAAAALTEAQAPSTAGANQAKEDPAQPQQQQQEAQRAQQMPADGTVAATAAPAATPGVKQEPQDISPDAYAPSAGPAALALLREATAAGFLPPCESEVRYFLLADSVFDAGELLQLYGDKLVGSFVGTRAVASVQRSGAVRESVVSVKVDQSKVEQGYPLLAPGLLKLRDAVPQLKGGDLPPSAAAQQQGGSRRNKKQKQGEPDAAAAAALEAAVAAGITETAETSRLLLALRCLRETWEARPGSKLPMLLQLLLFGKPQQSEVAEVIDLAAADDDDQLQQHLMSMDGDEGLVVTKVVAPKQSSRKRKAGRVSSGEEEDRSGDDRDVGAAKRVKQEPGV